MYGPNVFIAALGAAGIFAIYFGLIAVRESSLRELDILRGRAEKPRGFMERIQAKLDQANIPISAKEFLTTSLLLGTGLFFLILLITRLIIPSLMGFVIGFMAYWTYLEDRRERLRQRYQAALADVVDAMRESFAAGQSLPQVIDSIAQYGPPIAREDFRTLSAQLAAGKKVSIAQPLGELTRKRRDPLLDMLAQVLIVHEEEGGEIGPVLEEVSRCIRDRVRIRRQVRANQMLPIWEGRLVAMAPFAFMIFMKLAMPSYAIPFYRTMMGQFSLLVAFLLSIAGYYAMHYVTMQSTRVIESFGVVGEEQGGGKR